MLKVGWRPECRWLECRVADGRCVRRHLDVICELLSLGVPSKHYLTGPQSAQLILSRNNELGLLWVTVA